MIRLHACPTAWERSEWRQPCRVFLIRRYQVASADRAGDGCITSRLLVAGLPTGAWGGPSDLITMVTSALFIRWHRGVAHSRHAHNRCMVPFHPNLDGQSGVGVLDNNFNCWGAQTACRRSRELVLRKCVLNPRCKLCKLGDKDHMASVHFGCLFCRCQKQVYYSGVMTEEKECCWDSLSGL